MLLLTATPPALPPFPGKRWHAFLERALVYSFLAAHAFLPPICLLQPTSLFFSVPYRGRHVLGGHVKAAAQPGDSEHMSFYKQTSLASNLLHRS